MRIKLAGAIATELFISACGAEIVMQPLYPLEKAYLDEAMAQPLHFDVPASESTAAWGRAQDYIAKFSALKIQTATTDLIDTYNPTGPGEFGYKVNRIEGHLSTHFSVDCFTTDSHGAGVANRSAHLLAYYIRVGDPVPERLVTWCPGVFETPYGAVCEEDDDLARLVRAGNTIR
jgi:hypothetical protein